ncbi:MAG: SLC13 family permease [Acutalibacteraceae bacterium]|nr:SLC13 family permease [Acutalibacteraceae bacterium]
MLLKIRTFIKKEAVLCISALCALLTMVAVPPDAEYTGYIDFRVLCLLFCLMAVVEGFKSVGAFRWLTCKLLNKVHNGRILGLCLVMLPFFSSMLVTNDVALIVFVPFTVALLSQLGFTKSVVPIIVLQTVAANLGSMATPVGNPQNLFLYSTFNLTIGEFFSVTLPLTAFCFVLLSVSSLPVLPSALPENELKDEKISSPKSLVIYALVFILCLLTVFRVVPYVLSTAVVILTFLFADKKLLKKVDFMLLLTFVCFFIISENLGRIDAVREFLSSLLEKSTLVTSVGASQVISNVPAAVLLSGFTDDWRSLLSGVNIGGLGTPVASLASLITLKLYLKTEKAKIGKFLAVFTLFNAAGLLLLLGFEIII